MSGRMRVLERVYASVCTVYGNERKSGTSWLSGVLQLGVVFKVFQDKFFLDKLYRSR